MPETQANSQVRAKYLILGAVFCSSVLSAVEELHQQPERMPGNLSNVVCKQKRLAMSLFKCGKDKVWLNPDKQTTIGEANTRMIELSVSHCRRRYSKLD